MISHYQPLRPSTSSSVRVLTSTAASPVFPFLLLGLLALLLPAPGASVPYSTHEDHAGLASILLGADGPRNSRSVVEDGTGLFQGGEEDEDGGYLGRGEDRYVSKGGYTNFLRLLSGVMRLNAEVAGLKQKTGMPAVQKREPQKLCKPPKMIMCHDGGLMGVWARLYKNPKYSD